MTINDINGSATVDVPVTEPDRPPEELGDVCYIDGAEIPEGHYYIPTDITEAQGSTKYTFLPCAEGSAPLYPPPIPVDTMVIETQPPTPVMTQLPETGMAIDITIIAAGILSLGVILYRFANR